MVADLLKQRFHFQSGHFAYRRHYQRTATALVCCYDLLDPSLAPEQHQQADCQCHHRSEQYVESVTVLKFGHVLEVHAEDARYQAERKKYRRHYGQNAYDFVSAVRHCREMQLYHGFDCTLLFYSETTAPPDVFPEVAESYRQVVIEFGTGIFLPLYYSVFLSFAMQTQRQQVLPVVDKREPVVERMFRIEQVATPVVKPHGQRLAHCKKAIHHDAENLVSKRDVKSRSASLAIQQACADLGNGTAVGGTHRDQCLYDQEKRRRAAGELLRISVGCEACENNHLVFAGGVVIRGLVRVEAVPDMPLMDDYAGQFFHLLRPAGVGFAHEVQLQQSALWPALDGFKPFGYARIEDVEYFHVWPLLFGVPADAA